MSTHIIIFNNLGQTWDMFRRKWSDEIRSINKRLELWQPEVAMAKCSAEKNGLKADFIFIEENDNAQELLEIAIKQNEW